MSDRIRSVTGEEMGPNTVETRKADLAFGALLSETRSADTDAARVSRLVRSLSLAKLCDTSELTEVAVAHSILALHLDPAISHALEAKGLFTIRDLEKLTVDRLVQIDGIGVEGAYQVIARLDDFVHTRRVDQPAEASTDSTEAACEPRNADSPCAPPIEFTMVQRYLRGAGLRSDLSLPLSAICDTGALPDVDRVLPLSVLGSMSQQVNALFRAGIKTVGQLERMSAEELLEVPRLGPRGAWKIILHLHSFAQSDEAARYGDGPNALWEALAVGRAPADLSPALQDAADLTLGAVCDTGIVRQHVVDLPVSALSLDREHTIALQGERIESVGRLAAVTVDDLKRIPGLGPRRTWRLMRALHALIQAQVQEDHARAKDAWSLRAKDQEHVEPETSLIDAIRAATWTLLDREAMIVRLRHGLSGGRRHSYGEVATLCGLSAPRCREIERAALRQLRRPLQTYASPYLRALGYIQERIGLLEGDPRFLTALVRRFPEMEGRVTRQAIDILLGMPEIYGYRGDEVVGFDHSVCAVLAREGPLPLDRLAERACDELPGSTLERGLGQFEPAERIWLIGPAVRSRDDLYRLPPDAERPPPE